jgi:DNA-binding response OmpR family regulator
MTREETPDVILLGEDLDADPSRLVDGLRAAAPQALILFLMSGVSARRVAYIISLGVDDVVAPPHLASGVLLRAMASPLLQARAREGRVREGRPEVLLVDRFSRMVLNQDEPVSLTAREFELLERLLDARGRVVSREDLLADIWGEDQDSEAVLDATIHRLRRKLETDHSSPRLLVTIRGIGYRLESSRVAISDD